MLESVQRRHKYHRSTLVVDEAWPRSHSNSSSSSVSSSSTKRCAQPGLSSSKSLLLVQQPLLDTISTSSRTFQHQVVGRKTLLNTPSAPTSRPPPPSTISTTTVANKREHHRQQREPMVNNNKNEPACSSCKAKLRLNNRGENYCNECGKIQLRSVVGNVFNGKTLSSRKRTGSEESSDSMAYRSNMGETGAMKKLPALLDLQPSKIYQCQRPSINAQTSAPVPLMSFVNNLSNFAASNFMSSSTQPTSVFSLPQMFPKSIPRSSSSSLKSTSPKHSDRSSAERSSSSIRSHPYARADYVRGADLKKLPDQRSSSSRKSVVRRSGSDGSSRRSKRRMTTVTKGTNTDTRLETDLEWLHQQRAEIDKRIKELEAKEMANLEGDTRGLESISYLNGYYCHICRKYLRGNYRTKVAHCHDESHLNNYSTSKDSEDPLPQDPDSLLKYYESKYEIEFDFDDEENDQINSTSGDDQDGKIDLDPKTDQSKVDEQIVAPRSSNKANEQSTSDQSAIADRAIDETGNSSDEDDEEDDEIDNRRERFDRTKISR